MTEKERMLAGLLYKANDLELEADAYRCRLFNEKYNNTSIKDIDKRSKILGDWLGEVGEDVVLVPPVYFDYGSNTTIGNHFFSNTDLIILDVAKVQIGTGVMFGPRVSLYTAGHPIDALVRAEQLEFGLPIVIEDDVWLGGNVVVNPGVTIGARSVIASGSIVTKDIPADVVAGGNPCKIIREITSVDKDYWNKEREKYLKLE
ncbi:sugar O-acetyltransferase [Erysipelothrix urinaevulpis]|uniref:sugar O-acetyltransferase n=1 Tax=Erysipelothrix urinaevulpis TaxID=2683717 RepID=UPI001914E92F|nr:sugar O-acetyltransferase [Erysipelothrix urinaevulpis]